MGLKKESVAVSVIVPIYNSESYLSRCLNSLMNQSLKNVEFILVNDGSTDNSNTIIKKYMQQDSRFSLIEQKNLGVGTARNNGIKKAKGDYISFVDSDDYIELQMLEDMYLTALSKDLDIIVSRYQKVNSNNQIIQQGPDYSNFDKESMFKSLLTMSIPSVCWNALYKRSLFKQSDCLFPSKNIYNEDTATLYKLFYYANSIEFTNSIYYNWHYVPNSKTNSISLKHIDDMYRIVQSFKKFLLEHNIYSHYKYEFIYAYFKAISKKRFQIVQFGKEKKEKYLTYLIKKFTTKKLFNTMGEILIFRKTYPFIYFNTLLLLKQTIQFDNPLLNYFTEEDKNIIDSLLLKNCGLEQTLFDYIKNQGIKKLYIYGTGQLLNTFLMEKSHTIEIIQILDREPKILDQFSPAVYVKSLNHTTIKKNSTIIVLSLSFAKEITQRLQQYSDKNTLNLRILNFYNCISSKS